MDCHYVCNYFSAEIGEAADRSRMHVVDFVLASWLALPQLGIEIGLLTEGLQVRVLPEEPWNQLLTRSSNLNFAY